MGSTCVARLAGTRLASTVTNSITVAITTNVAGSRGLTPTNMERTSGLSPNEAAIPMRFIYRIDAISRDAKPK